jgi:assimilatory nitrate reductase catalytic subunit
VSPTASSPSGTVRTTCPYCGVGCGLRVDRAALRGEQAVPGVAADSSSGEPVIKGDPEHPANLGRMCSKGAALADTLGLEGRLLYPEIRGRRASWDEALDAVANGFRRAVDAHGPDSVAFYVSGQLLTEDYYVANKLMKGFIGSANIDTNSRLCMASAVAGYKRAFGTDTVPCDYADLELADLIVLVGSNLAWCHPVLYQRVVQAKSENDKLRVVVIDPRRTATCDVADLFLQIRPGSDVILFNGLLNHLRRDDALDWEFLDAHTEGFGAALSAAKESAPSVTSVASACGLDADDVLELFRWFAHTPRVVTAFSQGVNQSTSGTDKVNAIVNVHLATGRIGKPGMGPFSLTGQPNAMGGREVGGLANQLAAHMDFAAENVDRVRRFWNAPRIATSAGLKAVDLFDAVDVGRIKAIWIMSTNPVVSMPDADRVRRALERCEVVVVSDCMRETDTTACAHVLLPAATWGEKSGTVTNSERRISRQRPFLPAPGETRADWSIVCDVAARMGFGAEFSYRGAADVFREHARLSAFENDGARAFDIGACARITDAEYESLEPFQWPRPARGARVSRPFADGRFYTRGGKARFVATLPRAPAHRSSAEYPLVLNTGRIRDQWHTMTRTGRSARLMGHEPEPFVLVHPLDAARFGVANGDLAEVRSATGSVIVRARVGDAVVPGHVFVPMHWSARFANGGRVGGLIASATDPVSGQPELKHTPVSVRRYDAAWHGFALSREPLALGDFAYIARARGQGHWRYELAGDSTPSSWSEWADALLGPRVERVELSDSAGRYRGARVVGERLQACVFVARSKALPSRTWLAGLFAVDTLDDAARAAILAGRPAKAGQESGPIVCSCFSVGRSTLLRAIRTQELVSAEAIGRVLRAGTNCGSCVPEIKALLVEAASSSAGSVAIEA